MQPLPSTAVQAPTRHVHATIRPPATAGRVEAVLDGAAGRFELYYQSQAALHPAAATFVGAALLPAMAKGAAFTVAGAALSPRLRDALPTLQDIYQAWAPTLRRVQVDGEAPLGTSVGEADARRVGTFFTGGVDSFYTFLKHADAIDSLIYVHGFDVGLDDHALRRQVSQALHRIAAAFGKELIEVETNLKAFLQRFRLTPGFRNWELVHGAALASVAHLLGRTHRRIYLPAGSHYGHLYPWGSHPLLDPLWSTEHVEIVHDGCEAYRVDKCARIATSDVALATVRVCWKNPEGAYNCGRCEKCLRTMANLLAVGALDRCTAFEAPFDLQRLSKTAISPTIMYQWQATLETMRRRQAPRERREALARAVRNAERRSRVKRYAKHLIRRVRALYS